MRLEIYQGEEIRVTSEQFSLLGKIEKGLSYHIKLYQGLDLILEWKLPSIMLTSKITIIKQNLPFPILNYSRKFFLGFKIDFAIHKVEISFNPFRRRPYLIFVDSQKVAFAFFPTLLTAGYRKFTLETQTEERNVNLAIVLAFLVHLLPVT